MPSVGGRRSVALVLLIVAVSSLTGVAGSKSFNISNKCSYTVWPGILSGGAGATASVAALHSTGFELEPGESRAMAIPSGWSGHIWGRTLCSTDTGTGKFTCVAGDCGSGRQECAGRGPAPPATLAQFTLDGNDGGMDLYDVSLVDGFNLPMLVAARNCAPTGCAVDLNGLCPPALRVTSSSAAAGTGTVVACKSACLAFGAPRYCCTGEYGSPNTCRPSAYSELFKKACLRAFSYAYDGVDSVFSCAAADTIYATTFCPGPARRPTSAKKASSTGSSPRSQPPARDGNLPQTHGGTTPSTGVGSQVVGAATAPWRIVLVVGVLGAVKVFLTVRYTAVTGLTGPGRLSSRPVKKI